LEQLSAISEQSPADYFDLDALNTLLEYNREDVMNLQVLKDRLLTLQHSQQQAPVRLKTRSSRPFSLTVIPLSEIVNSGL